MGATPLPDDTTSVAGAPRHIPARTIARVAGLVAGDAAAFLVFAAAGRESHGEAAGLQAVASVALTAAPFALGWFLVAPFAGAYRRALTATPRTMLGHTALAWLASWPVALLLRWAFTGRVPPVSFALVTLVANLLFLSLWRGGYALVAARREA